ncbi:MAG: hypothetical protein HGA46_08675 [Chlorobiaceae bacterium]|nr:hypothetical protein [Chlorobiaceae bacterium]
MGIASLGILKQLRLRLVVRRITVRFQGDHGKIRHHNLCRSISSMLQIVFRHIARSYQARFNYRR